MRHDSALIGNLKRHGRVLFVVDQPATIRALPSAVAQAEGALVGYLLGLAMRRIADLHAGEAKTDARNAAIIAQAARTLPHALRSIQIADEQAAELSMLCGFDDDLVGQATATSNRIRGLLTQIHPDPSRSARFLEFRASAISRRTVANDSDDSESIVLVLRL